MDVSTRNGASNALIQISSTQPTHIRVIANATGVTQVNSGLIQFYASNITDQTNAGIEAVAHTTILGGLTNQAGVILVNLTTFKPDGTVDCASYTWMSYRGGHLLRMLESNESITIPTTTTVFHDAHPHLRGHATIDREP